jgi:hypothetical protein
VFDMPLREQSVTLGVDFLTHPNVMSHSREDKTSFLQNKGLTQMEIEEAFNRANGEEPSTMLAAPEGGAAAPGGVTGAPPQQQQQQYQQPPKQPKQYYAPPPPGLFFLYGVMGYHVISCAF